MHSKKDSYKKIHFWGVTEHGLATHLLGKRKITDTINEFLKASLPRGFQHAGFQAKQLRERPRIQPFIAIVSHQPPQNTQPSSNTAGEWLSLRHPVDKGTVLLPCLCQTR